MEATATTMTQATQIATAALIVMTSRPRSAGDTSGECAHHTPYTSKCLSEELLNHMNHL
jgi:hypothetical protein